MITIQSYCHIWPESLSKGNLRLIDFSSRPAESSREARLSAVGTSSNTKPSSHERLVQFYRALNINYPKFHKMDNLSKLGFLGAEVLFDGGEQTESTSVVFGNLSSSLESDRVFQESLNDIPSPAQFVYTLPNIVVGEICIRHKIQGENSFLLTSQFDSQALIDAIVQSLVFGGADQCLSGWIECINDDFYGFLFLAKYGEGELELTKSVLDTLYMKK